LLSKIIDLAKISPLGIISKFTGNTSLKSWLLNYDAGKESSFYCSELYYIESTDGHPE